MNIVSRNQITLVHVICQFTDKNKIKTFLTCTDNRDPMAVSLVVQRVVCTVFTKLSIHVEGDIFAMKYGFQT